MTMITSIRHLLGGLALAALAVPALAADLPQMRAAMLATGTVNWEIATIKGNGLDTANGFDLAVTDYADNGATRVALEGGEADVVVADWIWVGTAARRGQGLCVHPLFARRGRAGGEGRQRHQGPARSGGQEDRHRGRTAGQELADPARLCPAGIRHGSGGPDRAGLWRAAADLQGGAGWRDPGGDQLLAFPGQDEGAGHGRSGIDDRCRPGAGPRPRYAAARLCAARANLSRRTPKLPPGLPGRRARPRICWPPTMRPGTHCARR